MPLQVVQAPRHLAPQDRDLRRLGAQEAPRSLKGLLERRKGGFVVAALELSRAQTVQGVDVVRISVQRGLKRGSGELVPAQAKPTPSETVGETLPGRLTPECGLERNGRPAEVSEEILGPREQRPGLVMLGVERGRLGKLITCLLVLALLEQDAAAREARLCLHAPAEALKESRRGRQEHGRS